MANINLTTYEKKEGGESMLSGGFIFGIAILIIAGIAYAVLYFWDSSLKSKTEELKGQYSSEEAAFKKGDSRIVVDFRDRLQIAEGLVLEQNIPVTTFTEIQERVIPGVYIASYTFSSKDNSIVLRCVADGFNTIAKQIANFKKESNYIYNVLTGEGEYTAEGKVEMPIGFNIKNTPPMIANSSM